MKYFDDLRYFLNFEGVRGAFGINICLSKYVLHLLSDTNMVDSKTLSYTPNMILLLLFNT